MLRFILFIVIILSILQSCNKKSTEVSCTGLGQALSVEDEEQVREYISTICSTLPSSKNEEDVATRRLQVDMLVEKLNTKCGVSVTDVCFECIKTLPESTHIQLEFSMDGRQNSRTIDIGSVYNGKPRFIGMH